MAERRGRRVRAIASKRREDVVAYTIMGLTLVLAGCQTDSAYTTAPLEEITLQQIETAIESGDAIPALQDLSALMNLRSVPKDRAERISRDAALSIRTQFFEAVSDENFVDAYRLIQSLEFLEPDADFDSWSSRAVLEAMASKAAEDGNALVSLILLLRASADELDGIRILGKIEQLARESGYFSFERYALSELNPKPVDQIGSIIDPREMGRMIDGTVTIWVNRGIRIERGVGYPDAVIGSGFFVDSAGHIVTNYHVIESEVDPEYEGFSRLYIRSPDDDSLKIPARVVGYDRVFDLALLKVDIEPGYIFSPAIRETNFPGDRIYAIGSPVGLTKSITSGIISATGRRFLQMGDAMQVDVPINPGNSGGPLVNEYGEFIGVVFAGIEQFEGINFAIPTRWILSSIPRLYNGGEVRYPWIGASVASHPEGLEVLYVLPGEPAHRAGLEVSDVIFELAGKPVEEIESTQAELIELLPGTLAPMRWKREESSMSGAIALSSRPDYPVDLALDRDVSDNLIPALFGMVLTTTERSVFGNSYVVDRVIRGSVADETGLSAKDPLSIRDFVIDLDTRVAYMQIVVQKRKAGFIERAIQIGTYLEIDTFL